MQVCSNPHVYFNPDLAAETIEVICKRCGRHADRASAVVLRPELLVRLRVECHGFVFQRDLVELFMSEQLRVTIDFDARLCAVDDRGIVHAAQLRVDLPRRGSQAIVKTACYDASGTIVSGRTLTCLACYRLRRAWGSKARGAR